MRPCVITTETFGGLWEGRQFAAGQRAHTFPGVKLSSAEVLMEKLASVVHLHPIQVSNCSLLSDVEVSHSRRCRLLVAKQFCVGKFLVALVPSAWFTQQSALPKWTSWYAVQTHSSHKLSWRTVAWHSVAVKLLSSVDHSCDP